MQLEEVSLQEVGYQRDISSSCIFRSRSSLCLAVFYKAVYLFTTNLLIVFHIISSATKYSVLFLSFMFYIMTSLTIITKVTSLLDSSKIEAEIFLNRFRHHCVKILRKCQAQLNLLLMDINRFRHTWCVRFHIFTNNSRKHENQTI